MERKDFRLSLWKEYLEQGNEYSDREQEILFNIAFCYQKDMSFLMQIYEGFVEGFRTLHDDDNEIVYERERDDHFLSLKGSEICMKKDKFRKMFISMLDIMEDTLPLGTIVDLRNDIYKAAPNVKDVTNIRMVVTHRFLGNENDKHYYPYGGVVYPTGMLGEKRILYFTRPLVKKVVSLGYRDEQEETFVYLMKKDLIMEQGINSFGYATEEEIEAFNQKVKEGAG